MHAWRFDATSGRAMRASDLVTHETDLLNLMDALTTLERDFSIRRGFNLFEALNITRQEIRHSRFLAYLLDPSETHGLGDKFLRAILLAVIGENADVPVGRLSVALQDLSESVVYCERDHFDITVQIPALNLLFVIENKVDAGEREAQLIDYRTRARERYQEYKFLGCFLTPNGYEGDDDSWFTLSYGDVCGELLRLREQEALAVDVGVAVQHYIELVQRRIMASQDLINACRDIYIKHRAAFELIIEHGQQSTLAAAFERFMESHPGLERSSLRSGSVYFHHREWLQLKGGPQASRETNWTSDFPIRFWIRLEESRLLLFLDVGPLLNPASENSRNALVTEVCKPFNGKPSRGKKFTRVARAEVKLTEDHSVDDVFEAMEQAWKKLGGDKAPGLVVTAIQQWVAAETAPPSTVEIIGAPT